MTKLLALLAALAAAVGCNGPIGVGTTANYTETVCVVPSGRLTVQDVQNAADVWHDADARVNMVVRNADDGPREECDTVVQVKTLGYPCGATTMTGENIYIDTRAECDLMTVEPHELGHLLLNGDHSPDPNDLMYAASTNYTPSPADLARLPR